MNLRRITTSRETALEAIRAYRLHRDTYDARDWEIERIYRAVSQGRMVISVIDAIRTAGVDLNGRPRIAISRADEQSVRCYSSANETVFEPRSSSRWNIKVPSFGISPYKSMVGNLPRIPPQYRPVAKQLKNYWILWEADWTDVPVDPALLRRIGKDAWAVCAVWDLTQVEVSVMRAYRGER